MKGHSPTITVSFSAFSLQARLQCASNGGLSTSRGGAEIWAYAQGLHNLGRRTEIWAMAQKLWSRFTPSVANLWAQYLMNFGVGYLCSHSWSGSHGSSCKLCGWAHAEAGLGLKWFHSPHSRCKCTTIAVPMPDYRESVLMNLHWRLCEHTA